MSKEQGKGKMHPLVAFDETNRKYKLIEAQWLQKTGLPLDFQPTNDDSLSEDYIQTLFETMNDIFTIYMQTGVDYILENIDNVDIINLISFYKSVTIDNELKVKLANISLNDLLEEGIENFGIEQINEAQLRKAQLRKDYFAVVYDGKDDYYQLLVSFDLVRNFQMEPISGLAALVALASFSKDIFLGNVNLKKEGGYLRADANMAYFLSHLAKNFDGVFLSSAEKALVNKYPKGEKSLNSRDQNKVFKYVSGSDIGKNNFSSN